MRFGVLLVPLSLLVIAVPRSARACTMDNSCYNQANNPGYLTCNYPSSGSFAIGWSFTPPSAATFPICLGAGYLVPGIFSDNTISAGVAGKQSTPTATVTGCEGKASESGTVAVNGNFCGLTLTGSGAWSNSLDVTACQTSMPPYGCICTSGIKKESIKGTINGNLTFGGGPKVIGFSAVVAPLTSRMPRWMSSWLTDSTIGKCLDEAAQATVTPNVTGNVNYSPDTEETGDCAGNTTTCLQDSGGGNLGGSVTFNLKASTMCKSLGWGGGSDTWVPVLRIDVGANASLSAGAKVQASCTGDCNIYTLNLGGTIFTRIQAGIGGWSNYTWYGGLNCNIPVSYNSCTSAFSGPKSVSDFWNNYCRVF